MGQSLQKIAETLKVSDKKVQLLYAFNGSGKTRLSREFKKLIDPKDPEKEQDEESVLKILYYNAFTEDLFYWDNDLVTDTDRKLKIQPNSFTDWILREQGQDQNIIGNFQKLANDKLTPQFNEDFTEVRFSYQRGNDEETEFVKISKGEESCFIWSIYYSLLEQVITVLNIPDEEHRETDKYNKLEYIFIDDPVSSLDDNHLIELAVNIAELIKSSNSDPKIKFIITTHNPLFYNVLYSELDLNAGYILNKRNDESFELIEKKGDSNKSFSYHLFLIQTIKEAINKNAIQKYHFTLLRNLYEKTANFLGYPRWSELLPDDKQTYYKRIIQFTSHSTLSNEVVAEPTQPEKETVKLLLNHLTENYNYWKEANNVTV